MFKHLGLLVLLILIALLLVCPTSLNAQDADPARQPYQRAMERYLREDFDGAIQEFNRVIALSRSRDGVSRTAAHFDARTQDQQTVEITFVSPLTAAAFAGRGLARYRQGDVSGAIADCDQALLLNPGLAEAYNNRGIMRWSRGDFDGALADFDRLIKIRPSAQTYANRGNIFLDKGDDKAALADLERAVALNPRNAEFYCSRGLARRNSGDVDGGLADCDRALALDPKLARGFYCRGVAFYSKRDFAGSAAEFRRAIELDPKMAEAHGNLGWVLSLLGQPVEAEKEINECLRLDPSLKAKLERRMNEGKSKRSSK